ncbi:MAG: GTPase Era, partial [Phaeodactylibacter sp.]|nr:GTPase Era [Phaeodactylibacter sp.]
NVGKSTLMNALVGERMSIITNKPQTTRHRIIGILSDTDFQLVFSDTPGIIEDPTYEMQKAMNRFVHSTFEDGDIMLVVVAPDEVYEEDDAIFRRLPNLNIPVILAINKVDTLEPEQLEAMIQNWKDRYPFKEIIPISALQKDNTEYLLQQIKELLPLGPAYYPKDQLTDRPERFFVSEIVREQILELYHQEIPYSCEVIVDAFKEGETNSGEAITRIAATIYVSRKSQKPILIGKNGTAIKKLSTESRKAIEKFLETKVFLELHVKVRDNWRDDEQLLRHFGYQQ